MYTMAKGVLCFGAFLYFTPTGNARAEPRSTPVGYTSAPTRATHMYLRCLQRGHDFTPLETIHHSNSERLDSMDTSAPSAWPVIIRGLNTGFLQHDTPVTSLAQFMELLSHAGYEDTAVRWQHLSTGNASSKNLTVANGNFQEYYTSFAKASLRFEKNMPSAVETETQYWY